MKPWFAGCQTRCLQHFLDGITEVVGRPREPCRIPSGPDIFTLGECVPLPVEVGSGAEGIQSRIVLYHGSFAALAAAAGRISTGALEAWETLTHELRHHLEWRARAPDLEDLDWAVEHNFARHDGESFDPTFFLSGERQSEGVYLSRKMSSSTAGSLASTDHELRLGRTKLPRRCSGRCHIALFPDRLRCGEPTGQEI